MKSIHMLLAGSPSAAITNCSQRQGFVPLETSSARRAVEVHSPNPDRRSKVREDEPSTMRAPFGTKSEPKVTDQEDADRHKDDQRFHFSGLRCSVAVSSTANTMRELKRSKNSAPIMHLSFAPWLAWIGAPRQRSVCPLLCRLLFLSGLGPRPLGLWFAVRLHAGRPIFPDLQGSRRP